MEEETDKEHKAGPRCQVDVNLKNAEVYSLFAYSIFVLSWTQQTQINYPMDEVYALHTCYNGIIVYFCQHLVSKNMVQIEGKYQHEWNENLDAYFSAVGVPYIPRKMMLMSRPLLEVISKDDQWILRSITMMRTHEVAFKLEEDYDEFMPTGDALKCKTTRNGDSLVTVSEAPNGAKATRTYTFSEDGLLLTMAHEQSGEIAKRYFKRI